ncbi:hypothetical protein [Sodalinema gerasimenkoae]|uniref:hypothetical protein n=1 Tax=Sodalinema gerasimenkoae TaxID=2862348 RepID=UPI0013570880|nr:hypothetical protein [Sodalinema gerasimenkoae]
MKPQKTLSNPSLLELLECLIPNVVGLYIDGYLGFGLSLVLFLYHWRHRRGEKHGEKRFLFCLSASLLLLVFSHEPSPGGLLPQRDAPRQEINRQR